MKVGKTSKFSTYLITVVGFIVTIAVVYFLMPRDKQFEYYYEVGKPWTYDLLVAPHTFPIYKDEAQLKKEKFEALKSLKPYLKQNTAVQNAMIQEFDIAAKKYSFNKDIVAFYLNEAYQTGIISYELKEKYEKMKISSVRIIDENNVAHEVPLSKLFTPSAAYTYVTNALKENGLDFSDVQSINLDVYLQQPNLEEDKTKTNQEEEELLSRIDSKQGVVQEGVRIIDRGEVVTPDICRILDSFKIDQRETGNVSQRNIWSILGRLILLVVLFLFQFIYFYLYRPKVTNSYRSLLLMVIMMVFMLALLSIVQRFTGFNPYIIPFAILPLVLKVFFDSNSALFVHITTILIASRMVANPSEFVIMQIIVGMVAVLSLKEMSSRSQLVKSAALIFCTYIVTFTAMELARGVMWSNFHWENYLYFFISSLLLLFTYIIIFIVEKLFGFLSSLTLVELSNINNPILMEFSEKCPGTFQHVLQVSNLAVEVSKAIGADTLLARTGALYHDLGKMSNPLYFTENQTAGINPLNDLPFEEAAQIIISHVTDGVRMAQKAGLPQSVIDFIAMHHGCSKTKYFYNSFKNKYPDVEIDDSKFTYPGPLPSTKETVILMMSDAVEAASRSLKSYNEQDIDKLVDNVVNGQVADGQFRNSPISFRDVEIAKQVFKDKLKNIYHSRISYPELKK